MATVCFVCTGNTCRSFMAESLMKHALEASSDAMRAVTCFSRGVAVRDEGPAENAIRALHEFNCFSLWRSKSLQKENLQRHAPTAFDARKDVPGDATTWQATLFVCMTQRHRTLLMEQLPSTFPESNVTLLLGDRDLDDPYGCDIKRYRETLNAMWPHVEMLSETHTHRESTGNE